MKNLLKLAAALLFMTMIFSGCGNTSENAADPVDAEPSERVNIAVNLGEKNNYSEKLAKELTNKLWQNNFNIILDYAEGNPQLQAEQLEGYLSRDIKCLVVSPVDPDSIKLDSFSQNDIPVIDIDSLIPDEENVAFFISYDNIGAGELVGDYIAEKEQLANNMGLTIEFLMGADSKASEDFFNGIMNKLRPYLESGSLVCRSGRTEYESVSSTAKNAVSAFKDFERFLSGYYINKDLDICITGSDQLANGCIAYLMTQGYYTDEFPVVTGANGEPSAVRDLRQGLLSMTVLKDTKKTAEICTDAASALISGEKVSSLANTKSSDEYMNIPTYIIAPSRLTADNFEDALINSGYYTEDECFE